MAQQERPCFPPDSPTLHSKRMPPSTLSSEESYLHAQGCSQLDSFHEKNSTILAVLVEVATSSISGSAWRSSCSQQSRLWQESDLEHAGLTSQQQWHLKFPLGRILAEAQGCFCCYSSFMLNLVKLGSVSPHHARDTPLALLCVQLSAKAIFGELSYVCQSQRSWGCNPTASL